MSNLTENLNDVKYFKDSDCLHNDPNLFRRLSCECSSCRLNKPSLYQQCVEYHYGPRQAARILGTIPDRARPLQEAEAEQQKSEPEHISKDSDPPPRQLDYSQNLLEVYDGVDIEDQRGIYERALKDLEELKRKNWKLRERVFNLKLRFNRQMLNRYPEVVAEYALEIMIWEIILHEAMVKGRRQAKKEGRKEFEFLYETDAKQFGQRFGLSYYKALKVMKQLVDMGAWEVIESKRNKVRVFYLGEKWINDSRYPVDLVLFRLKNPNTKAFLESEKDKDKIK